MRTKLGRWFWALMTGLGLIWIALPTVASENGTLDGKVAVVNGKVITQEDLKREMSGVRQRLLRAGKPISDFRLQEIRKNVLETLINQELLYQEAQKEGIQVKDATIDEKLATLKKRFPNEDEFKSALSRMNLSSTSLRFQIKKNLTIQQLVNEQFAKNVTISNKEIRDYYDSHPDSFRRPEQVRARHILIKVNGKARESQRALARKKLKEIQGRAQGGENFAVLAKEFSEGPSSARGGDLGYFGRGRMVKPFEEAAFALKPGEVSGIVETEFGYHLIKCIDKKPKSTIAYKDVKDKLHQYLRQEKVREEVMTHIGDLRKRAKVKRFLGNDRYQGKKR